MSLIDEEIHDKFIKIIKDIMPKIGDILSEEDVKNNFSLDESLYFYNILISSFISQIVFAVFKLNNFSITEKNSSHYIDIACDTAKETLQKWIKLI